VSAENETPLELEKARKAVRLAAELCTAIDLADDDIGGARPIKQILEELGPAIDAALARLADVAHPPSAVAKSVATEAADRIAELERRMVHMASSTADDWRWYQNQARQACRALGIECSGLDWS
jgi:hypothetical protein